MHAVETLKRSLATVRAMLTGRRLRAQLGPASRGCTRRISAFLVAALALAMVHGGLGPVPVIGSYITSALGGVSGLFNAAAVTVIVVGTAKRLMP